MQSILKINGLELWVNLGWRNAERSQEQVVLLDMTIQYLTIPKACENDELNDTVCYAALIETLRDQIAAKHYHLIEHLSADIYEISKKELPLDSKLSVRITKYPKRYVQGLTGGVSFIFGDGVLS